jgi:xanthine/uracil/vitamin C permease (AzgA family)
MGLNAYFASSVVGYRGTGNVPYEEALAGIFVEGWLFVLLAVTGIRAAIIKLVPRCVPWRLLARQLVAASGAALHGCHQPARHRLAATSLHGGEADSWHFFSCARINIYTSIYLSSVISHDRSIMLATSSGIGLFLAFIGLQAQQGLGISTYSPTSVVTLGAPPKLQTLTEH